MFETVATSSSLSTKYEIVKLNGIVTQSETTSVNGLGSDIKIRSEQEIILATKEGETSIVLDDFTIACRPGHQLSLLAIYNLNIKKPSGFFFYGYNHDTNKDLMHKSSIERTLNLSSPFLSVFAIISVMIMSYAYISDLSAVFAVIFSIVAIGIAFALLSPILMWSTFIINAFRARWILKNKDLTECIDAL
jgi:hypothetical protein